MYRRYLRFRSLLFSFSSFYLHLTRSVVHKFDFLLSIVTILCYPSDRLDDIGLIVSLVVSACIAVAHYVLGRFAVRSSRIAIIRWLRRLDTKRPTSYSLFGLCVPRFSFLWFMECGAYNPSSLLAFMLACFLERCHKRGLSFSVWRGSRQFALELWLWFFQFAYTSFLAKVWRVCIRNINISMMQLMTTSITLRKGSTKAKQRRMTSNQSLGGLTIVFDDLYSVRVDLIGEIMSPDISTKGWDSEFDPGFLSSKFHLSWTLSLSLYQYSISFS